MNIHRHEYMALTNQAWVIRRQLADKHDCKASEISWKASLLLALADDREADASAARAAAAELLPRTRWQDVALAIWDTIKPRASFPIQRLVGLAVLVIAATIIL